MSTTASRTGAFIVFYMTPKHPECPTGKMVEMRRHHFLSAAWLLVCTSVFNMILFAIFRKRMDTDSPVWIVLAIATFVGTFIYFYWTRRKYLQTLRVRTEFLNRAVDQV